MPKSKMRRKLTPGNLMLLKKSTSTSAMMALMKYRWMMQKL
jgi:hypothetical protein